jgi:acyl transferase domain-containing protein
LCSRLVANEAAAMDPQCRIMLEETLTALTAAEESKGSLANTKTGVYVGSMYQEYVDVLVGLGQSVSPAVVTGNSMSFLVGRVSYTFDFKVGHSPLLVACCDQ